MKINGRSVHTCVYCLRTGIRGYVSTRLGWRCKSGDACEKRIRHEQVRGR